MPLNMPFSPTLLACLVLSVLVSRTGAITCPHDPAGLAALDPALSSACLSLQSLISAATAAGRTSGVTFVATDITLASPSGGANNPRPTVTSAVASTQGPGGAAGGAGANSQTSPTASGARPSASSNASTGPSGTAASAGSSAASGTNGATAATGTGAGAGSPTGTAAGAGAGASPSPTVTPSQSSSDSHFGTHVLLPAILCSVVGALIIAIIIFFCCRRQMRRRKGSEEEFGVAGAGAAAGLAASSPHSSHDAEKSGAMEKDLNGTTFLAPPSRQQNTGTDSPQLPPVGLTEPDGGTWFEGPARSISEYSDQGARPSLDQRSHGKALPIAVGAGGAAMGGIGAAMLARDSGNTSVPRPEQSVQKDALPISAKESIERDFPGLGTVPQPAPQSSLQTTPQSSLQTAPQSSFQTAPQSAFQTAPQSSLRSAPGPFAQAIPPTAPQTASSLGAGTMGTSGMGKSGNAPVGSSSSRGIEPEMTESASSSKGFLATGAGIGAAALGAIGLGAMVSGSSKENEEPQKPSTPDSGNWLSNATGPSPAQRSTNYTDLRDPEDEPYDAGPPTVGTTTTTTDTASFATPNEYAHNDSREGFEFAHTGDEGNEGMNTPRALTPDGSPRAVPGAFPPSVPEPEASEGTSTPIAGERSTWIGSNYSQNIMGAKSDNSSSRVTGNAPAIATGAGVATLSSAAAASAYTPQFTRDVNTSRAPYNSPATPTAPSSTPTQAQELQPSLSSASQSTVRRDMPASNSAAAPAALASSPTFLRETNTSRASYNTPATPTASSSLQKQVQPQMEQAQVSPTPETTRRKPVPLGTAAASAALVSAARTTSQPQQEQAKQPQSASTPYSPVRGTDPVGSGAPPAAVGAARRVSSSSPPPSPSAGASGYRFASPRRDAYDSPPSGSQETGYYQRSPTQGAQSPPRQYQQYSPQQQSPIHGAQSPRRSEEQSQQYQQQQPTRGEHSPPQTSSPPSGRRFSFPRRSSNEAAAAAAAAPSSSQSRPGASSPTGSYRQVPEYVPPPPRPPVSSVMQRGSLRGYQTPPRPSGPVHRDSGEGAVGQSPTYKKGKPISPYRGDVDDRVG